MKFLIALAAAALAVQTQASVVEIFGEARNVTGGKVAHIGAVSTVASGTVTVKAETLYYTNAVEVVSLPPVTNTTYRLVYTDGSTTLTNEVDYVQDLTGLSYVSYTTNTVVTTPTVTNDVRRLALAVTNTVDTLTCSSGVGAKSPEDKWVAPGKVWFEGTAKGRVFLFLE